MGRDTGEVFGTGIPRQRRQWHWIALVLSLMFFAIGIFGFAFGEGRPPPPEHSADHFCEGEPELILSCPGSTDSPAGSAECVRQRGGRCHCEFTLEEHEFELDVQMAYDGLAPSPDAHFVLSHDEYSWRSQVGLFPSLSDPGRIAIRDGVLCGELFDTRFARDPESLGPVAALDSSEEGRPSPGAGLNSLLQWIFFSLLCFAYWLWASADAKGKRIISAQTLSESGGRHETKSEDGSGLSRGVPRLSSARMSFDAGIILIAMGALLPSIVALTICAWRNPDLDFDELIASPAILFLCLPLAAALICGVRLAIFRYRVSHEPKR